MGEQRGHTPLWISALRGHVEVVRVLLSHPNIDIDYKDLSGVTALWAACQNNNSEVVELLLHPRNVVVQTAVDNHGHQRVVSLTNERKLFDGNAMNQLASMFDDESDDNEDKPHKNGYNNDDSNDESDLSELETEENHNIRRNQ